MEKAKGSQRGKGVSQGVQRSRGFGLQMGKVKKTHWEPRGWREHFKLRVL